MILAPTWKDYFAARESNTSGNKNPGLFLSAWSDSNSLEAKLQLINNDPDIAVLAANAGQEIMILHSFKNLGGTILSPADKMACLFGGNRMAPVVIVDEVPLTDNLDIMTPSTEDILACTTIEALSQLDAPLAEANEDTITYRGGNTFLPPPWLLDTIFEAHSDDPLTLILAAKTGASRFNEKQLAADPTYTPNTDVILNEFVMWAWAVKRNLVHATRYYLDPYDTDMDNYQALRHQQCIGSTTTPPLNTMPPGIPPVFTMPTVPGTHGTFPTPTTTTANDSILQQLAVSITRQSEEAATHNELFARQLEHSLEKEDKKKDRLKKFHPSIKQLILFASAEEADAVPDEILDSCKRVFNADTITNAEQELTLQFSNMGMQDANFAPSFVTSLYSGKFMWSKNFTPSNFSPFMIFEAEPLLAPDQSQRHLILHLEDTTGKNSEDITQSGKLTVKAPTKFHEMFHQLKFFRGACVIIFGASSIAASSLHALIQLVDNSKHIFKSHEIDIEFMSKFLLAVDKRFQLWLESCMTLSTRTEVDDSVLNFLPLVNSVRYGTFELRLPLTFKTKEQDRAPTAKANNKRPHGGGNGSGDTADDAAAAGNPKKKKKGTKVTNEHQPDQFKMRTGETWATHFANKNVNQRVPWDSEAKMCPRWFIAGYCFDNCYHKSSHVKADDIPAEKLTEFKSFLDNIRGN